MSELLPCPFETCDPDCLTIVTANDDRYRLDIFKAHVECEECGATGPNNWARGIEAAKSLAAYAWNTRTPPAPTVQEAKTAPVNGGEFHIPWKLHLETCWTYFRYADNLVMTETPDAIAKRGGFSASDMDILSLNWRSSATKVEQEPSAAKSDAGKPALAALSNGEKETGS